MRVILLLAAALGLLAGPLSTLAPDDEWHFAPPDAPPALLHESRKHTPKQPLSASERQAVDAPQPAAPSLGNWAFPLALASLAPRYLRHPRPEATGPPALLRRAVR